MNGEPTKIDEIAPLVKFLATDRWWITGQTIFANGGYTTRFHPTTPGKQVAALIRARLLESLGIGDLLRPTEAS